MATATAITNSTALRIERGEMIRVMDEEHSLSHLFLAFLLASVYVSRAGDGQLHVLPPSVPTWVAACPGKPIMTSLSAHVMAGSSKQVGSASPVRRRAPWTAFGLRSKMASCRFTSSISVPTCPIRKR
jgi:hypothetical protein